MKTKANDNLKSAQMLINNKQYTTSVHCSYYAAFQYMKYMLANTDRNPISLQVQNAYDGVSSHEFILKEIKNRLKKTLKEERNFEDDVRYLKKERVDADYSNRVFTDIESLDDKEKAEGIISKLKTYFGNI